MEMNEKIKKLRMQRGLTLEQVGNYVGVGKSTVRKWENGMIENMRRDKIARLAVILGTTPDYLMGWKDEKDEWSASFCSSLSQELSLINHSDAEAAGIDLDRLEVVSNGNVPISLHEACNIADQLGSSLDHMVGLRQINSKAAEFIELFSRLTSEQQSIVISQIKGILANQHLFSKKGVSSDTVMVYRAAHSDDNHAGEIVQMSNKELQELKDAPETDDPL